MKRQNYRIYEFGPFRFDIAERRLSRGGRSVHLPPKTLYVLANLLRRQGQVVTKDELLNAVWADNEVEENNLTVSISILRKALGEKGGAQKYIETVQKRGYRFVAPLKVLNTSSPEPCKSQELFTHADIVNIYVAAFEPLELGADEGYLAVLLPHALTVKINRIKGEPMLHAVVGVDERQTASVPQMRNYKGGLIMFGQIQKSGARLRLNIQLTDTREHDLLWVGDFYWSGENIFEGVDVISDLAARAYGEAVKGGEHAMLAKRPTLSTQAYQSYVRARHLWDRRNREDLEESIKCFERAIEIDPSFALAHAGLANCFMLVSEYCLLPPKQAMGRAKAAAQRALELDDTLAEAYAILAYINAVFDWDWEEAEKLFLRAINFSPTYATAHQWYADMLAVLGRFDESIAMIKRARKLDPLSSIINASVGHYLYFARRFNQSIAECQRALNLDPKSPMAHLYMGLAYGQKKMFMEARNEIHRAVELSGGNFETLAAWGYICAVSGDTEMAREVLKHLKCASLKGYVSPYSFALIHAGLGENDLALKWLGQACEERSDWMPYLYIAPEFDSLREETGFKEILRRMRPGDGGSCNTQSIRTLAVLPLVNEKGSRDLDYLSDGLTETLIKSLSNLPQFRVIARNTVFNQKARGRSAKDIGQSLNADLVLAGRIMQSDENLSVGVELIETADGVRLWGGDYQCIPSHVMAVPDDIVMDVSESLRLRLTSEERKRLYKRDTENFKAYQLYLKGRHSLNKRTKESIYHALKLFERAIKEDENYALAHIGVADCNILLSSMSISSPQQSVPFIKAAVNRALELDETLAEAHASLGYLKMVREWDWVGAERELRLAIQLNPNYPTAHHWYAIYLRQRGRFDEALAEVRRAQRLDPLSAIISTAVGGVFYYARQYDSAIVELLETLDVEPGFYVARAVLGMSYVEKGMHQEAIKELEQVLQASSDTEALALLGYVYGRAGQRSMVKKVLNKLGRLMKHGYVDPFHLAMVHIGNEDHKAAHDWLRAAYDNRSELMTALKTFPALDSLRSEPWFKDMMHRVGLTDA